MDLRPGDRVGDYEVVQIFGSGGMGQVLKVRHQLTQRIEAMKLVLPEMIESPELALRFQSEIQLLARLDHPNIARLYTAQYFDGHLAMLMEFINGVTLLDLQEQRRIPMAEALDYIRQTLDALDFLHQNRVVHRDIKPANLMITDDGVVKVLDFGIAKVMGARGLTHQGTLVGTVAYMSPEQVRGNPDLIDGRSDIYSTGIVLYEILSGHLPFESDSDYDIMSAHVSTTPTSLLGRVSEITPAMDGVVMKALAKEPSERFQTAGEFRMALQSALESQQPIRRTLQNGQARAATVLETQAQQIVTGQKAVTNGIGKKDVSSLSASHPARLATRIALAALAATILLSAVWGTKYFVDHSKQVVADNSAVTGNSGQQSTGDNSQKLAAANVQHPQINQPNAPATNGNNQYGKNTPAPSPEVPKKVIGPGQEFVINPNPNSFVSAADQHQLDELQERMVGLHARAKSADTRWQAMRLQLASQGLNLRSDKATSLDKLSSYMTLADNSLRAKDITGAKRAMDSAESELRHLE